MAAPTLVSIDAAVSAGGITFGPHQTDDVMVVLFGGYAAALETSEPGAAVVSVDPSNLYPVGLTKPVFGEYVGAQHEVIRGPAGGGGGAGVDQWFRLAWARVPSTASTLAVVVGEANGNTPGYTVGALLRGASTTEPIDAVNISDSGSTATTSIAIPGVATGAPNCLVLDGVFTVRTSTGVGTAPGNQLSGWSNGGLDSYAEAWNEFTNSATSRSNGGIAGVKSSPGASGDTTAIATLAHYLLYFSVAFGGSREGGGWGPRDVGW